MTREAGNPQCSKSIWKTGWGSEGAQWGAASNQVWFWPDLKAASASKLYFAKDWRKGWDWYVLTYTQWQRVFKWSWREKPAPFQHLGRKKLRAALKTARLNWRGGECVLYPHIHLKDLSKISSRKGSQVWFEDLKVNNPISLSPRSIYLINLTIPSSNSCNVSLLHLSSWCFYLMLTWLMSDLW